MTVDLAATTLDDADEAEWALLHDQFELADGFWLGFIFSPTFTVPRVMAARVAGMLRAHGGMLRVWRPETPEALRSLAPEIAAAARRGTTDCLWIEALSNDLSGIDPGAGWEAAWSEFLMRLNERREVMVKHHRGGVVLVAPVAVKVLARERSPDLWTYRSIVIELGTKVRPRQESRTSTTTAAAASELNEDDQRILKAALAALDVAPRFTAASGPVRAAIPVLWKTGRTDTLRLILLRLLSLPREDEIGPHVAQILSALAQCELVQGDKPAAIDHLRAALRHADGVDDAQEMLWCQVLQELLAEQLALVEAAEYGDRAVRHARRLAAPPASTNALRDLSVSLNKLGDIRSDLGDLSAAERAYAESLELRRRLLTLRGDVPEALRDLVLVLTGLADVCARRGEVARSRALVNEARGLVTRLREFEQRGLYVGTIPELPEDDGEA